MKKTLTFLAFAMASIMAIPAAAQNDAEVIRDRNKSLSNMEYKAEKLKIQADMAESLKRMVEAQFLVDEDGNPIGVDDMEVLGAQVRNNQDYGADMPFPMDTGFGEMNRPMDVSMGPPPTLPTDRFVVRPEFGPTRPRVSGPQEQEPPKPTMTRLVEVRGDYVVIRTSANEMMELRVNEKFDGMKLAKIGIDSAHFKGKNGTRVMRINWVNSSASTE